MASVESSPSRERPILGGELPPSLSAAWKDHILEVILQGIQNSRERFGELVRFPERETISHIIEELTAEFKRIAIARDRGMEGVDDLKQALLYRSEIYRKVMSLLIRAGIAVPITRTDWQVDRVESSEAGLGFRTGGLASLETLLFQKYGQGNRKSRCLHLHNGPGNGAAMDDLRRIRADESSSTRRPKVWTEVGKGDLLFVEIHSILERFMLPLEGSQRKAEALRFVRSIALGLQKALGKIFYEKDPGGQRRLREEIPFTDMNLLLGLLAKPESWIHEVYSETRATLTASGEFEDDTEENLLNAVRLYKRLSQYGGWSEEQMNEQIKLRKIQFLERSQKIIGKKKNSLHELRNRILEERNRRAYRLFKEKNLARGNQSGESHDKVTNQMDPEIVSDLRKNFKSQLDELNKEAMTQMDPEMVTDLRGALDSLLKKKNGKKKAKKRRATTDLIPILNEIEVELQKVNAQRTKISKDISELREGLQKCDLSTPDKENGLSPILVLEKIFSPDLTEAIEHASLYDGYQVPDRYPHSDRPVLDLNLYAHAFFQNFFQVDFKKEDNPLQNFSFLLISEFRSTSHLPHEVFLEFLRRNMESLEPGGVLISDGAPRSYSRALRLSELRQAVGDNPQFKVEIIFEEETNRLLSFLLQRGHPIQGFLGEEEKRSFFQKGVYIESVKSAMERPRLVTLDRVCRMIEPLAINGNIEGVFRNLHGEIEQYVDELLIYVAVQKAYRIYIGGAENETHDDKIKMLCAHWKITPNELVAWIRNIVDGAGIQNRLLDEKDIEVIVGHVEVRVRRSVEKSQWLVPKAALPLAPASLHPESPHPSFRVFLDRTLPPAPHNRRMLYIPSFPLNGELTTSLAAERVREKTERLREFLKGIFQKIGHSPLTLVTFKDCYTNVALFQRIRELLGDTLASQLVTHIPVSLLEAEDGKGEARINLWQERYAHLFAQVLERPGMFLGGGSWHNAYDRLGVQVKEKIYRPLIEAIYKGDPTMLFGICFTGQCIADLIGEIFYRKKIITTSGALEIGASGIQVNEVSSPLFRDMRKQLAVIETHAGHILDSRSEQMKTDFHPLAHSLATGLPVAWSAAQGNILATQFHPEVDLIKADRGPIELSPDIIGIMQQLSISYEEVLRRRYRITPGDVGREFQRAIVSGDETRAIVEGNATEILLNGLLHQAYRLSQSL